MFSDIDIYHVFMINLTFQRKNVKLKLKKNKCNQIKTKKIIFLLFMKRIKCFDQDYKFRLGANNSLS